jgi:hypothetical protein
MSDAPTITLEWVRAEKAKHKSILADLEATERVLLLRQSEAAPPIPPTPHTPKPPEGYGAKKRVLLGVIADAKPNGLTTPAVITAGTKAGLVGLKTENTSPQLSSYKSDGLLELRDGLWHITLSGMAFLAESEEIKRRRL